MSMMNPRWHADVVIGFLRPEMRVIALIRLRRCRPLGLTQGPADLINCFVCILIGFGIVEVVKLIRP
jgi:hypothetical protein